VLLAFVLPAIMQFTFAAGRRGQDSGAADRLSIQAEN
jgi:hypothetical protein